MIDTKLRGLYESERQDAWEQARELTAGPMPKITSFQHDTPHPFPASFVILVVSLCLIVFIAAFTPSAYRLSIAGSVEFCTSLQVDNDPRCQHVGIATVLLAEVGQAVFILALAVLPTDRPHQIGPVSFRTTSVLLYSGAAASTVLAIAGNAHISRPWEFGGALFDYLITFIPPLLVMAVGYVLKEVMVTFVRRRHEAFMLYQRALGERQLRLLDPTSQTSWLRHYTVAIRDAIRKANRRHKDILDKLSREQWEYLIRREMLASTWEVHPDRPTRLELEDSNHELPKLTSETGEVWQLPNGQWGARSFRSGTLLGEAYQKEGHARNALNNHHRSLDRAGK